MSLTCIHSLQRIANSTCTGGPSGVDLARFMECLHDPEARLTYTALTGERKQSVADAERLFSPSVLAFMEKRGYDFEANYIRAVLNWRRACDERGLSELQRSHFNYQMLHYILDELIPWHKQYDYSYLEVNRYCDSAYIVPTYMYIHCTCIFYAGVSMQSVGLPGKL